MLPSRLFPFLRHFLARQQAVFLFLCLISLMWSVEQVMFPYCIKLMVDALTRFSGERADIMAVLAWPLTLGGIVWVTSVIAWRIADVLDYFFSPRFQADIRENMVEYVFGHSHRYFSEHLAGSVANKISDMVNASHYLVTQSVRFYLPNLVSVLLVAAFMTAISPVFGIILLLWAAAHLWICIYFSRASDAVSHAHSEVRSELVGRIVDSIGNYLTVRLFARSRDELEYLREHQREEVRRYKRVLLTMTKVKLLLEIPSAVMMLFMLYFLITGWQAGWVSTGDAVFVLNTSFNLMYILWRVGMELPAYYREIGVASQALTLLSEPHEIRDLPNAAPLYVGKGEIVFEDVHFDYFPGQNLFAGKSLVIAPGQKLGLVGFSGSGKTTFVNLILRLYDVEGGRILIDGEDIAQVTQDSLRAQIATIAQDPLLFNRSLMENIRYGRLDASDAEVMGAARQALAHDFIMELNGGYAAIVGERGVKLSGGQRQRIAIARAILKDAPIVIFDEATSALDSATEKTIQQNMKTVLQGKTAIVIAHRLSTLVAMDRILVFDKGRIVEDGPHAGLIRKGGHYARLWALQAGGFLPEREGLSS